jgi:4,5-dihydroxyphthalate decarboxylase
MHRRVMEITGGDPLPYGIEPNRGPLEELISSAVEQGILSRAPAPAIENLFARNTRHLVG